MFSMPPGLSDLRSFIIDLELWLDHPMGTARYPSRLEKKKRNLETANIS